MERWEEIADELGSYDLQTTGYPYITHEEMVRVDVSNTQYVGEWVDAEDACKRIAALEAERDELKDELDALRRTIFTLQSVIDVDEFNEARAKEVK